MTGLGPSGTSLFAPSLLLANGRFFAVGSGAFGTGGGAMVWTSKDGRSWSRVEAASFQDRSVKDIVDSPVGTFAIGYEAPIESDDTRGFLVWPVRAEGSFGEPRVIDLVGADRIISGASWTGREFLAWASTRWRVGETTLLSSQDGMTWTVLSTITRPASSYISDVLAVGDRLIAVGASGRVFRPRAWVSDDEGRSWTIANVEGADGYIANVSMEAGSLIARGTAPALDGDDASWSSIEGTAWIRLPDDKDTPAIPGFHSSIPASIGKLTCVAGTFDALAVPHGAIYCRLHT